ncbi:MAG: S1 RNA-binding domain-containing protein, partial [Acidobacteria bacterium]
SEAESAAAPSSEAQAAAAAEPAAAAGAGPDAESVATAESEAESAAAPSSEAQAGAAAESAAAAAAESAAESAAAAAAESAAESAAAAAAESEVESAAAPSSEAQASGDGTGAADKSAASAAEGEKAPLEELALDPALAPLVEAQLNQRPVKGKVIGWNKGGYHVAIDTIAAFCPVSQIEIDKPRSPKSYLDRSFEFMVIEIEKRGRRVVVSRAEALKAAKKERAARVRETVKPGQDYDGEVTSLTDFGAFVRIAKGIEGLVHISEISRKRVEHPRELLKVGQKVKVRVLKVDRNGERISLSMKKLEADPWKSVAERYPTGTPFTGIIRRKTDFGLFVEVEPGIEGLVHTSRLPFGMSLDHESLEIGNEVKGWAVDADPKRRRLALSLREVPTSQPWKEVESRFPVGSVVTGQVERVATFGAFIQLEPGLTGLLPFSELKQDGRGGANLKRQFHAGKEVSVRVLSIDTGRKRISLGTESSKAVGTQADYRAYKSRKPKGGMGAMAAAFAKLQERQQQQSS